MTTGKYPFEGDNIYRLLENIGKNQWIPPDWFRKFDTNLSNLINGMLQSNPNERLTLQQIKKHPLVYRKINICRYRYTTNCNCISIFRWTIGSPGRVGSYLTIPPLKNDELRSSTVLPYLDAYHYGADETEEDYYTEHDLTGVYYQMEYSVYDLFQSFFLFSSSFLVRKMASSATNRTNSAKKSHSSSTTSTKNKKFSQKLSACMSVRNLTSCRPS